ncbi:MAG: hypothetical protein NC406_02060 [Bacteroides sp.]|nr:hypothetical protein [Bacteroides sp.]MCM1094969.1 hypothetical protein [Terasakiella sp.]
MRKIFILILLVVSVAACKTQSPNYGYGVAYRCNDPLCMGLEYVLFESEGIGIHLGNRYGCTVGELSKRINDTIFFSPIFSYSWLWTDQGKKRRAIIPDSGSSLADRVPIYLVFSGDTIWEIQDYRPYAPDSIEDPILDGYDVEYRLYERVR